MKQRDPEFEMLADESVSYQDRQSFFRVGADEGGEVGVGVFLLWNGDRWSEPEGPEGLLDKLMSNPMEGRVDKLQGTPGVQIPETGGPTHTHTQVFRRVCESPGWCRA